jgi:hypothetical protein
VGEHGSPGGSGSAGGEHEHGEVVVAPLDQRGGLVSEQVAEDQRIDEVESARLDDDLERRQRTAVDPGEGTGGGGTHQAGAGVHHGQLTLQLGGGGRRVDGHDHQAGAEPGQPPDHEVPVVGRHDGHAVPGL